MSKLEQRARQEALDCFLRERFNCAESVLWGVVAAQRRYYDCVPQIATGFGGGMGGCGETCGALVGGIMALGLKYGRTKGSDIERKQRTGAFVKELIGAFREEFGSLRCIELTNVDMSTPEGMQRAIDLRLHDEFCPKFVEFVAAKVAEMLERKVS